ncbi:MAG: glycosyltransferase family 4 protein [Clostridiales bacterium]|nr:glycosyltransferase family 4 protein [Clostridiales bacterium]
MDSRTVLFITRKYPPMKGGMESYSYNLISNYDGDYVLKALGKKQIHLLWFYPYCLIYVLFNARKFDVIQLGDMLLCGIGWLAKKINRKVKVIVTIHGLDITYSNPIYQIYLRLFSHDFDAYVPNSSYTRSVAEKNGYHPCHVIPPATINNNINDTHICTKKEFYQKYGLPKDTFVICTVGRLVKRKGVEWFIYNVLPKINYSKLVYLVAGSGYMESPIQEAINNTHDNRVNLLGRVTEQELADLYAHSDIFLMPNIYVENDVEGYGMVAVEAAAAGCLVVAANMQGISDAVKDGISGILYEPESVKDLADLLNDIINHYDNYRNIKATAQEYVKTECTGKAVAEKYKTLIWNDIDM